MTVMDQYYRAYFEYMQAVSSLRPHQELEKALCTSDCGRDSHSGNIKYCVIDPEWLETIERALPSLDIAIRENRRFITQKDEVVPIEKSRKITNESVRYLAQHTNTIAKVEGDNVTPESLLNIFHEENFAIYENRFLRTLLDKTIYFVETRYQAIASYTDSFHANLKMEREFSFEQENTYFKIEYNSEMPEQKKSDVNADISTLSDLERVIRIKKILTEFSNLPLMRELQNAERVRSPITRTNIILKDAYFREAMELWTFIESYHREGYHYVLYDAEGAMTSSVQQGLYDALDFLRFSLRLKLSPPLQEMLQSNYDREKQRKAAEMERMEAARNRKEKLRLESAVEHERKEQKAKIEALIQAHQEEMTEIESEFDLKLERQKEAFAAEQSYRNDMFENQLQEQRKNHETNIVSLRNEFESDIASQKAEYEKKISSQADKLRYEYQAENQRLIQQLDEAHVRMTKAEEEVKELKRKLSSSENKLSQEKKASELLRKNLNKNTAKLQQRLESAENRYRIRLSRQEYLSQCKIDRLEKKLRKAISKCSCEEVMSAGE